MLFAAPQKCAKLQRFGTERDMLSLFLCVLIEVLYVIIGGFQDLRSMRIMLLIVHAN